MNGTTTKRRLIPAHGTPEDNARRVLQIARQTRAAHGWATTAADLGDLVKCRCAALHLAYDGDVVGAAVRIVLEGRRGGGL